MPSTTSMGTYTTGTLARLLRVSQQNIIRCCEDGRLPHFHPPGRGNSGRSRHRRILPADALAFAKAQGLPTDLLEADLRGEEIVG